MKVGVLGLGSIGGRHADNLKKLGHNVIGYDPKIHADISREEVIEEAEAIVIASPSNQHLKDILDCIGKPTFVEKPMASSSHIKFTEAAHLIVAINNLFVGYNLRFHPCVRQMKKWIHDEWRIGGPLYASFVCGQYNAKSEYLRDGVILNWSHEIDLALHLLGPGEVAGSVTRTSNDYGQDDMTDILIKHYNGAHSHIHLDYATIPEMRTGFIQGSEGYMEYALSPRPGSVYLGMKSKDTEIYNDTFINYDNDYLEEMKAFIRYAEGGDPGPACMGKEALDVLDICLKVREQAGL